MRATLRAILVVVAFFLAVSACGSNSGGSSSTDSLVGNWAGKCGVTKDQDGSRVGDDVDAELRFTQDGKYSQTLAGPDGGHTDGTYTVAAQVISLKAQGDSVDAHYTIQDGRLTTKTQSNTDGSAITSTCTLRRS